jgi:hypothetical protein
MDPRSTAIERAFAIAASGECAGLSQLRAQLKAEGFSPLQLEGPDLHRQLRELCESSWRAADDDV